MSVPTTRRGQFLLLHYLTEILVDRVSLWLRRTLEKQPAKTDTVYLVSCSDKQEKRRCSSHKFLLVLFLALLTLESYMFHITVTCNSPSSSTTSDIAGLPFNKKLPNSPFAFPIVAPIWQVCLFVNITTDLQRNATYLSLLASY